MLAIPIFSYLLASDALDFVVLNFELFSESEKVVFCIL